MKNKSLLLCSIAIGIVIIFATTGIHAGTEVQDEIQMENPAYEKHKESIVMCIRKNAVSAITMKTTSRWRISRREMTYKTVSSATKSWGRHRVKQKRSGKPIRYQ